MSDTLVHHGILGMKWGVRRYQNEDETLTPLGRRRLEKKDDKWAKKNADKIIEKAKKQSSRELDQIANAIMRTPGTFKSNGKLSSAAVMAYNNKMSEIMTRKVSNLRSPSGRVVKFVAKRGEIGVMMALADAGYDMDQLKNGVWTSGKIAYKKKVLNKI